MMGYQDTTLIICMKILLLGQRMEQMLVMSNTEKVDSTAQMYVGFSLVKMGMQILLLPNY